ncbi:MAG: serine/threonine protein kinase [Planctomycetales bacterium]|nr:serine/threonine protein kinase [Planctomycetales bacterium]MBN8624720.1 serine/threonine protein kinase [Planctomycetota bacterium]
MATCAQSERTTAYALGHVDPSRIDEIAEHIEDCAHCQEALVRVAQAGDSLIALLHRAANAPALLAASEVTIAAAMALDAASAEFSPAQVDDCSATSIDDSACGADTVVAPASAEEFMRAVRSAKIVSHGDWEKFVRERADAGSSETPQSLAVQLIACGLLTSFQAEQALRGRAAGLLFDDYVVTDVIASGGMGRVFKACHRRMKRDVALKILPDAALTTSSQVRRFQREVELAARLVHPNIVIAHDAGVAHGRHYLVMEYVDGPDLAKTVVTDGPLPVARALDYVLQAARGLSFAHARGVVHRDIKPANLLVDAAGIVKILDMGIARLNNDADENSPESEKPESSSLDGLTRDGQLMGTVDFMAPEQAHDTRSAGERSDVYSLGCTLYYLLMGRPVFPADSAAQRIAAHRSAPIPDVRRERPDVPEAVQEIFARMTAKSPADRYGTMRDAVAALENVVASVGAVKRREGRPFARRYVRYALGALFVIPAGFVYWSSGRHEQPLRDLASPTVAAASIKLTPPASLAELLTSADYVWTAPEALRGGVNTEREERLWGITDDELVILYDDRLTVYESRRASRDDPFSTVTPVRPLLGLIRGAMSGDGLTAVGVKEVSRRRFELWFSTRSNVALPWSEPTKISEADYESPLAKHPALSPDGLTLLATTRRLGIPSADIEMFSRDSHDAPFVVAERLTGAVNTSGWDMPFFISDDRRVVIAADQVEQVRLVRVFTRSVIADPFDAGVPLEIPQLVDETSTGNSGFRLAAGGRSIYFDSAAFSAVTNQADICVSRRVRKK